jgi:hypothetical protein
MKNVFDHLHPIGKPVVWRLDLPIKHPWVVEYWLSHNMGEQFFSTWDDAIAFALAQATA